MYRNKNALGGWADADAVFRDDLGEVGHNYIYNCVPRRPWRGGAVDVLAIRSSEDCIPKKFDLAQAGKGGGHSFPENAYSLHGLALAGVKLGKPVER